MSTNTRRYWTILLLFLSISTLASACSPTPKWNIVSVPTFTPNPLAAPISAPTQTTAPTVLSSPTHSPTSTASNTPLPTASPEIDFPLAVNNTWRFKVTRYEGVPTTEIITTTLIVTETVVEVKNVSDTTTVRIHRAESAEEAVGQVPSSWQGIPLAPASSSDYWLIATGNRVYRQDNQLDLSNLNEALLQFVFPLHIGDEWYQSDAKARLYPTPIPNDFMLRQVTQVGDVIVPAGHFNDCFLMQEEWAGTTFATWFCPRVGIVERKVGHHGTPEGYHEVLLNYQLKK